MPKGSTQSGDAFQTFHLGDDAGQLARCVYTLAPHGSISAEQTKTVLPALHERHVQISRKIQLVLTHQQWILLVAMSAAGNLAALRQPTGAVVGCGHGLRL